ncbi:hypothetical protein GQ607_017105 [Colletotrichum asianum]|uniref:Uncharacterized protein n=1 Tax=Colletotrichum asianum TaxID=702518 RepID=A0A8H3ZE22_9PEZI|nr:hypothetical protein GQ607_017105 [Colletotrichum asianum]
MATMKRQMSLPTWTEKSKIPFANPETQRLRAMPSLHTASPSKKDSIDAQPGNMTAFLGRTAAKITKKCLRVLGWTAVAVALVLIGLVLAVLLEVAGSVLCLPLRVSSAENSASQSVCDVYVHSVRVISRLKSVVTDILMFIPAIGA